jgi:predicted nucleotidyltransferase
MYSLFFKYNSGAGEIRGAQIATRLNANVNPVANYENDVCIYVKQQPPEDFPKYSYLDVVDGDGLLRWAKAHPKIGIIATSGIAQNYLSNKLNRTDIKLIPQHHCNYERQQRTQGEVSTIGYIGSKNGLKRMGVFGSRITINTSFKNRQDVVNFYNDIDIQVAFRPDRDRLSNMKNSLKLYNAGSFGIPTVSYPTKAYLDEFKGCFIEAETVEEMVFQCDKLKIDKEFYREMSHKILSRSENYHIDKIIPLYKELPN